MLSMRPGPGRPGERRGGDRGSPARLDHSRCLGLTADNVYYVKSRMRLAGTRRRRPPRTGGRTFRLKSGKQMADELGMSSVKLMPGPPPQCEPSGNSLEEETCRSEDGFTLIELMVVLLILAILLAIAIPTFLGVTKSANDRAAQSNLNTALLNAKAQYQKNSQAYPATAALVTALTSAEPSLQFVDGSANPSTDQNHIAVFPTGDFAALVMSAYSVQTKNCWVVVDTPTSTAVAAPFAAAAAPNPPTGPDVTLNPSTANATVAFSTTQLGPTYAEIKNVTSAQCQPNLLKTSTGGYRYSYTAFPSI